MRSPGYFACYHVISPLAVPLRLVLLLCFASPPTVVFVFAIMFSAAARIASRTAVRAATNTSALSALRPAVAQPFVVRTFAASVSACKSVGYSGTWSIHRLSCVSKSHDFCLFCIGLDLAVVLWWFLTVLGLRGHDCRYVWVSSWLVCWRDKTIRPSSTPPRLPIASSLS